MHPGMAPPHGAPNEALLHFGLSGTTRPIDSIQQVADYFGKYAPCQIQGQGEYEGLLRFLGRRVKLEICKTKWTE